MVITDTSGYTWTFAPFSVTGMAHRKLGDGVVAVRIVQRFNAQPMEITATDIQFENFQRMLQDSWKTSVELSYGKPGKKKRG